VLCVTATDQVHFELAGTATLVGPAVCIAEAGIATAMVRVPHATTEICVTAICGALRAEHAYLQLKRIEAAATE
jgi:hypothetical protein